MNLELNKSTGNLFVNKSEFFFDNEQFISNNIFLKTMGLQKNENIFIILIFYLSSCLFQEIC